MARYGSMLHFIEILMYASHQHGSAVAYDKDYGKGYVRVEVMTEEDGHSFGIFYYTQDSFGRWNYEAWNDEEGHVLHEATKVRFTKEDYDRVIVPSAEVEIHHHHE